MNPLLKAIAYTGALWRAAGLAFKGHPAQGFSLSGAIPGQPLPKLDDVADLAQAMFKNPWVMIGVTRIAQNVASSPLKLQAEATVDGELQWVDIDTGDMADLLKYPNPTEGMDILLWKGTMSLFTGDAYFLKDDEGKPYLYHCRPQIISAVSDSDGGLAYWKLKYGRREKRLEPDQVIHVTYPSIIRDIYGQSPISSLTSKILLEKFYSNHLASFFQNHAVPTGLLRSEQPLDDRAVEETKKAWKRAYSGTHNAHEIAVVGDGTTYQEISPPLRDMVIETLHTIPRDTTLSVLGVPPVMAGVEVANYATAREQRKSFWQDTIIPIQKLFTAALTIQLARMQGDNYRIVADNSQVEALQPDRERQSKIAYRLYSGRVATLNEARDIVGLEAVDTGDEFAEVPTSGGDVLLSAPSARAEQEPPDPTRLNIWEAHYTLAVRGEKGLAAIMRRYFAGQKRRVLEGIEGMRLGRNGLMKTFLYEQIRNSVPSIVDPERENDLLRSMVMPYIEARVIAAYKRGVNQVKPEIAAAVVSPELRAYIYQMENRIVGINPVTWEKVQAILDEAYTEGWGYDLTAQKLGELYSGFSKSRAVTIARTETGAAMNGGSFYGYKEIGVKKKEWLPAYLPTSRRWHTDMGTVPPIPLEAKFSVGGEPMAHPHDPSASARNNVNCYCLLQPVIAEDY